MTLEFLSFLPDMARYQAGSNGDKYVVSVLVERDDGKKANVPIRITMHRELTDDVDVSFDTEAVDFT